jgi:hypothetical protein
MAPMPPAASAPESAGRADQRDGKADKKLKDQRDKPNARGHGKPGKTKNTSS